MVDDGDAPGHLVEQDIQRLSLHDKLPHGVATGQLSFPLQEGLAQARDRGVADYRPIGLARKTRMRYL
jgi:hypothetical protein